MNDPYQVLGIPETATDAEVKNAYRNLARKYHPDNYHDNPLADLAQERMKEINAAYEEVTRRRSGQGGGSAYGSSRSGSSYGGAYGGSYGYGGQQNYSGSPVLQQARMAINAGNLSHAESLLASCQDHNAEWNFLKGAICYRRGWMDEAKRYYQTACQMDPNNLEYRQALEFMESGGRGSYTPGGSPFGTEVCASNGMCLPLLCCCGPYCCI